MSLSIIIPTYDNVDFLDELFESIYRNKTSISFEVLIGIDGCEKTKDYIENKEFPVNFSFYYFKINDGPYKIKNTLSEIAEFDKILFFDSDDIMVENCIESIHKYLDKYECIKPKFVNFKDNNGNRVFDKVKGQYGEGVFGIDKKLFLSMNGFEGWKCAADSDFMGRIYKSKRKVGLTNEVLFNRRLHSGSLTKRKDTGYSSSLRGKYFSMSKKKTYFGPLPFLSKNEFQVLNTKTKEWENLVKINPTDESDPISDIKKKKQELIECVFNDRPKDVVPKEIKKINYDRVNNNTNIKTISNLNSALKKAKLDNLKKNIGR
jgi:glycosyltransferase involved in cell wall biosynthesis